MLLISTSQPQKKAFLRALARVASTDGILASEEEKYISMIAEQLNIDLAQVLEGTEWMTLREILAPVQDMVHRRSLLMELVRLAYCDGQFSAEESKLIGEMAEILGINGPTLLAIDSWARQDNEVQLLGLDIAQNGRE
jgi:uncharacterized tellurite resistance protein B-like protein